MLPFPFPISLFSGFFEAFEEDPYSPRKRGRFHVVLESLSPEGRQGESQDRMGEGQARNRFGAPCAGLATEIGAVDQGGRTVHPPSRNLDTSGALG